jgi:predicted peptidase
MFFLVTSVLVGAEVTPISDPLPEEKETEITCELKEAPRYQDIPVFDSNKDAMDSVGTYHYKLWVPAGYNADAAKSWPCLFVMSPGGHASMANMAGYLKSNGYVVVMLVEAKNGPWPPIVGNFLAAHDDVIQRMRITEGRKFATGQSGGARGSSVFVQIRPGFGGLILQSAGAAIGSSAGYHVDGLKKSSGPFIVMLLGDKDQNFSEIAKMKALIPSSRLKDITFAGGHVWAPAPVFEQGMAWLLEKLAGKTEGAEEPLP